jgi:two-component system, NarL family, nitrate/nitrite response regulator NarL
VPFRCLIVDDNAAFLETLRKVLEGRELTVVGDAATAAEALQRTEELRPDLVLLDIDLGDDSGFDVARRLADHAGPEAPKLILISVHCGEDFAEMVAESPALGFIAKSDLSAAAVIAVLRRDHAVPGDHAQPDSR